MTNETIVQWGGASAPDRRPLALLLDEQEASAQCLAEGLSRRGYRVAAAGSLGAAAALLPDGEWRGVGLVVCSATLPGAWKTGRPGGPGVVWPSFPPVALVLVGDVAPSQESDPALAVTFVARLDRPVTEEALEAALERCARWEEQVARLVRHRVFARQAQFVREPVARIVHDLNNQVMGLRGGLDLIGLTVRQIEPPDLRDRLERYLVEIVRPSLANVEQMFLCCRRGRERAPACTTAVDLAAATREALALVAGPAGRARVAVTLGGRPLPDEEAAWEAAVAAAPPVRVAADPDHVVPILAYLLENALEAIEGREEGRVLVEIAGADANGLCRVAVFDNGGGIPEGDRMQVWRSFFSTKGGDHAGLGLSFAKQLVDKQGGQVGLAPSPLGGAGVQVLLPAAPSAIYPASAGARAGGTE